MRVIKGFLGSAVCLVTAEALRKTDGMDPCRRTKMSIIAEILGTARRGVSRNEIMCKVNLSSKQMCQYLPIACQNDLLNRENDKAEYQTTERGFRFLEHYYSMMELLRVESNIKHHKQPLNM